jgi:ATP-dependent Lon protease
LMYLIMHYTREAGLRNLEREVGSLCRKVAKKFVFGHKEKIVVTPQNIPELLGPPRFLKEERLKENQVGISTGLAWTQAGGEVLYVEALKMRGKGGLILTGQLGDVMKESARAAWSYARAHSEELGIEEEFFDNYEVHIHLPAGAIPKDGPSAGVTMATALTSLMTGVPVRRDIAMTGEITLSGRVLPVGGIREKSLAALTHGVTTIILPLSNQKDLADIADEFKKKLSFVFVENLDEVFALAFDKKAPRQKLKEKPLKKPKSPAAAA